MLVVNTPWGLSRHNHIFFLVLLAFLTLVLEALTWHTQRYILMLLHQYIQCHMDHTQYPCGTFAELSSYSKYYAILHSLTCLEEWLILSVYLRDCILLDTEGVCQVLLKIIDHQSCSVHVHQEEQFSSSFYYQ